MKKLYFGTIQILLRKKKRNIADVLSQKYITIVLLWLSIFPLFFRRGEGLIEIFLFFFCCWFAIWQYSISPLFYIRLSYVAIKDDFCNSAPLFAFLWCVFLILFCFLVFCPQEETLYSASARLYSPMLLFFIVPLPLSSCPFPLALAFLANIWCY